MSESMAVRRARVAARRAEVCPRDHGGSLALADVVESLVTLAEAVLPEEREEAVRVTIRALLDVPRSGGLAGGGDALRTLAEAAIADAGRPLRAEEVRAAIDQMTPGIEWDQRAKDRLYHAVYRSPRFAFLPGRLWALRGE